MWKIFKKYPKLKGGKHANLEGGSSRPSKYYGAIEKRK